MKKLFLLTAFAAIWSFTSCNDDSAPAIQPTLPSGSTAPYVKSITHIGNMPESYDWTFKYKRGRMTEAKGMYRTYVTAEDRSHSYTSKIYYSSDEIGIKNDGAEGGVITLGADKLIADITSIDKTETQKFYYRNGLLTRWEKVYKGGSFGHVEELMTFAEIKYNDGDFEKVTYMQENSNIVDTICVLTFTSDTNLNSNGLLPEVISTELGLIGKEYFYYAGLLCGSSMHLVKSISAEYPKNPLLNWNVVFNYSISEGNTTSCSYIYKGQSASVEYTY